MARPKSVDPKVAVTLRLPRSVVARYEAMGEGWRAKLEAHIVERMTPAQPLLLRMPGADGVLGPPKRHVSRLKGEWKAP